MKFPIDSREDGFTLFEVIFIAATLSLGFLMVIEVFPMGLRAKEKAEQYSIATILAQQVIEEVKREGYEKLSATASSESGDYGVNKEEFELHEDYGYQLEWNNSEIPNLREVKIRILFDDSRTKMKDKDGYSKSYLANEDDSEECLELVTYLAKRR